MTKKPGVILLVGYLLLISNIGDASPIEHLIVVMMENRSFDHILGYMHMENSQINGLNGTQFNRYNPFDPASPKVFVNNQAPYVDPNPGHSCEATTRQIYGGPEHTNISPPPMNGFVMDAESMQTGWGPKIMSCFNPSTVPVISTLAREFALFDHYFSAMPGPTEVNRLFVHSGTSYGAADNYDDELIIGYPQKTIYDSLNEKNVSWAIFASEVTTTLDFETMRIPSNFDHIHMFSDFENMLRFGGLPSYSFLEPRYFGYSEWELANDQHPSHDVSQGELFIKRVYEQLRNSQYWDKSALVITYDEHGGFYDHVPPPTDAPNPDGYVSASPPFNFTRLGVRVPMIVASPWVQKGRLVHGPTNGPTPTSQFEHSSVPATVKNLFNLDSFLTKRDAWAAPFDFLFEELDAPRTDCPTTLPTPPINMYSRETSKHGGHTRPLNDLQKSILRSPLMIKYPELEMPEIHKIIDSFKTEREAAVFLREFLKTLIGH